MKISIFKEEARFSIKEHKKAVFGTTLLFTLISIMFSLCLIALTGEDGSLTTAGFIVYIVMFLVTIPLSCGVINTIVKISSNQKVGATEFINHSVKNFVKTWKILFRIFLKAIVISAIAFVLILGILIFLITVIKVSEQVVKITSVILSAIYTLILLIMLLPYSFSFFIFSENPDMNAKEIINKSKELMKGNLVSFILLTLSFIGWYLLITIIVNVIYYLVAINILPYALYFLSSYISTLFLTPYMLATQYAYYEDLLAEKDGNKKNNETKKEEAKVN